MCEGGARGGRPVPSGAASPSPAGAPSRSSPGRGAGRRRPTLLLVNLGSPEEPTTEAVRAFLREFLADPAVVDYPRWLWRPVLERVVLRSRPERVAALYRSISPAGGSPLRDATTRLAEALARRMGPGARVRAVYRYGRPSLAQALGSLAAASEPALILPLFPQRTGSTFGTIAAEVERRAAERRHAAPVRTLWLRPDAPGYVAAVADRIREALARCGGTAEHVVLSFHGIPWRHNRRERGCYRRDCEVTAEAVLRSLGWPRERASLAFQSRFGPEPWLGPATARVLRHLPRRGIRRVAVAMPGFLTDGLETLEEIAERGRRTFVEAGGETFVAATAAGDHPALLDEMASLAAEEAESRASA